MDVHHALAELTRSSVFKEWHAQHADYFLAHVFVLLDDANQNTYQIGFYNPKEERMVTFMLADGSVTHTEPQEVLKQEGDIVKLELEQVTVAADDVMKQAQELLEKEYKQTESIKKFFIVQYLDGHPVFNMTFLLKNFQTVNIKIHATTGETLSHSMQALATFG